MFHEFDLRFSPHGAGSGKGRAIGRIVSAYWQGHEAGDNALELSWHPLKPAPEDFDMPTSRPTIAILGASSNRAKYGNKAVRAFLKQGWDVYPVNPGETRIEGLRAYPNLDTVPLERLDRVSIYLPPAVGLSVIEDVARKVVDELWLNPGSESPALLERAAALGLTVIQACSIVDIGENPTSY
jgi:predicted CoA-binding protein